MRIGIKLTLAFFFIAFVSISIIGVISYVQGKKSLQEESFNKLTAVREMKAEQIEGYYQLIIDQAKTFAETPTIIEAMKCFDAGFDTILSELNPSAVILDSINLNLKDHYETEFLSKLNSNTGELNKYGDFIPGKNASKILQHLYIDINPHPVGSKHKLDSASDKSSYSGCHKKYHPFIRQYLEEFGYYDIFLVDIDSGNIVYTVFKEVDFATSLLTGPYKETNLAFAFKAAADSSSGKGFYQLVDYYAYAPSYNAPASFISTPIFEGDTKIGVLIFQMPIDRINNIMTSNQGWSNVGLGKSGETYIVGEDFTLRNQSRFLIEDSTNYFRMITDIGVPQETIDRIRAFNSTVGLQEVKTEGTQDALEGNTNTKIFPDYRGVPVLSAYRPLDIPGMNWVIMSEIDEEEAFAHIYTLRNNIFIGFGGLLVLIIIASLLISRQLTRPIKILTTDAMELAKGNLDVVIDVGARRKDEIGILALSFKKMQVSINNLISELKHINQNLENKVIERTQDLHRQKEIVEEKNKEIVDSINYAQRLQRAILPTLGTIKMNLPESFVLFKPKDIVSGDFYWMYSDSEEVLIAAVDCTGHGVPGAMVSVVGANSLDRCVKEFKLLKPAAILDRLSVLVTETFESSDHEVKDGMDISLCRLNVKTKKIEWAGANNPLWVIKNGKKGKAETDYFIEIKADKQPIGKFDFRKPFTNHELQLEEGDCIYLFTDGYADQFGGPNGKKLKYKTLKDLLISQHEKTMGEQMEKIDREFESWKGHLEQIDDVCVIGIRI
ncbi:MAG: SpoIIE family protein phosphatase [Bacteroidota bacterium]